MRQKTGIYSSVAMATAALAFWQVLALQYEAQPQQLQPAGGVRSYSADKTTSEIRFVAKSRLKPIQGMFEKWTAEVRMDPAKAESLNLTLTAQAASVKTGNFLEEGLLRGDNFFAPETYPEITLRSKKVEPKDSGYQMEAELTLRGQTHVVVFPFTIELNRSGEGKLQGECEFNRKDFGMTYNMPLNPIEDLVKVVVMLNVSGEPQEGKSAPAGKN